VGISTAALPNGVLKDAYSGVVTAGGGCTPCKWKLSSGSLPTGITMKSSNTNPVIRSGTPTKAATNSFSISVTGWAASTLYSDLTVADHCTYFYSTTAIDIQGNESVKSNIAKSAIP